MYSNPPVHGARIVAEVVNDEAMFGEWKEEMAMMSGRIMSVRGMLYDALTRINSDRDWSFVQQQIGMFSFTGARLPSQWCDRGARVLHAVRCLYGTGSYAHH